MQYSGEIRGRTTFDGSAALCLLLPAFMPLQFTIIGRLMAPELVIAAIFPYILLLRIHLFKDLLVRRVLVLGVLWLCGLVATDIIRHTAAADYLRGWALVSFTLIDFACFYLLVEKKIFRLKLLVLGWAIGTGLEIFLSPLEGAVRWKLGAGDAVIIGVMALIALLQKNFVSARGEGILGSIIGSALSVIFNARNLAGRTFLNAALLSLTYFRRYQRSAGLTPRRIAAIAVFTLPLTFVALEAYGVLADSGVMGEDAKATYQAQSNASFGVFGVMFGGRPEIFISSQAVMDSPVIGHGSWARSMYYYLKYRELARLGFDVSQSGVDDLQDLEAVRGAEPEIPAHSILMGSWVWGGLLGGVFWIYVLYLTLRCLAVVVPIRDTLTPLVISVCNLFLWDILFSPYGNDRRFEAAIFITLTIVATERLTKAASTRGFRPVAVGEFLSRRYATSVGAGQPPVFDKTVWLRNQLEHRLRKDIPDSSSPQRQS